MKTLVEGFWNYNNYLPRVERGDGTRYASRNLLDMCVYYLECTLCQSNFRSISRESGISYQISVAMISTIPLSFIPDIIRFSWPIVCHFCIIFPQLSFFSIGTQSDSSPEYAICSIIRSVYSDFSSPIVSRCWARFLPCMNGILANIYPSLFFVTSERERSSTLTSHPLNFFPRKVTFHHFVFAYLR